MQPVRAHRTESQLIQAIAATQFRVRERSSWQARAGTALGRCDHEAGARKMDTDLADRGIAAPNDDLMYARRNQFADDRITSGIVRSNADDLARLAKTMHRSFSPDKGEADDPAVYSPAPPLLLLTSEAVEGLATEPLPDSTQPSMCRKPCACAAAISISMSRGARPCPCQASAIMMANSQVSLPASEA